MTIPLSSNRHGMGLSLYGSYLKVCNNCAMHTNVTWSFKASDMLKVTWYPITSFIELLAGKSCHLCIPIHAGLFHLGHGLLLLFSSAIWTVTECIALLYLRGFDLLWCTCYSSSSNHGNRCIWSNMDNIPDRNVSQWNCLQRTCRSVLWYLTHL